MVKVKNPNYNQHIETSKKLDPGINKHSEPQDSPTTKEESENNESESKIDKFEEIKKYKELLDLGIITQSEFDKKKKELL